MLIAKSQRAKAELSRQFRQKSMTKIYRALASTSSPNSLLSEFVCEHPIGKLPYARLGYIYGATPEGKAARSIVRILERRTNSALVEVTIETGRPHQIRIHLAAAGFPLVGDPLYEVGGIPIENGTATPGDCGYWLHAHQLEFDHPTTGERLTVQAQPPEILSRRRMNR